RVDDRLAVEYRAPPVQGAAVPAVLAVGRAERERRLPPHIRARRDRRTLPVRRHRHDTPPMSAARARSGSPPPLEPASGSAAEGSCAGLACGDCSCTDSIGFPSASVTGSSRDQSWLITASTAEACVKPSCTRVTMVRASCSSTAARSLASIARNGIPRVLTARCARSSGGVTIVCSDAAAFAHRCASVPSPNRRRAATKFPAFSAEPCRPSENPTQDGGTPAADASRDSALPWVTENSISLKLSPLACGSAPPPRKSVLYAFSAPAYSASKIFLNSLTCCTVTVGSNLMTKLGVALLRRNARLWSVCRLSPSTSRITGVTQLMPTYTPSGSGTGA